jgi:hypothetical protein
VPTIAGAGRSPGHSADARGASDSTVAGVVTTAESERTARAVDAVAASTRLTGGHLTGFGSVAVGASHAHVATAARQKHEARSHFQRTIIDRTARGSERTQSRRDRPRLLRTSQPRASTSWSTRQFGAIPRHVALKPTRRV